MASESSSTATHADDATLHAIDELMHEVARLARSEVSPREFYSELLDRTVPALAAVGGVVWTRNANGRLETAAQAHVPAVQFAGQVTNKQQHRALLESVLNSGEPQ